MPSGVGVAISIAEFAVTSSDEVLSQLARRYAKAGFSSLSREATRAWEAELTGLQRFAAALRQARPEARDWGLALEFDIPRRQKRIDAVVIAPSAVFVLEFKSAENPTSQDQRQVEDYAVELSEFHQGSQGWPIVPLLVTPASGTLELAPVRSDDLVQDVSIAPISELHSVILQSLDRLPFSSDASLTPREWLDAAYCPTPTIIEAATCLYADHNVAEIARSEASRDNLMATQESISRSIAQARVSGEKVICFVTGVPGAGKTLAGLNAVCKRASNQDEVEAVFLSGNGPLVKVLTEALARDEHDRKRATMARARQRSGKFVQGVHAFIDHYASRSDAPVDRIVVFDEAQRAWNAEHSKRKFERPTSEPVAMLRIMDRHPDWAVLICLVGGGQEINTGEAGLREWGRALETGFEHWQVFVSPELRAGSDGPVGQSLFGDNARSDVVVDRNLHLFVPVRAHRGTRVAEWVDAVLEGQPQDASRVARECGDFDLVMTRSLEETRDWLRRRTRGQRRCGLVASSGGKRLRRFGIDVESRIQVEHWFLNEPSDVRSSHYLEQMATEFDIQGLELDRVGIAWDADLRYCDGQWHYRRFKGTKWQSIRKEADQTYLVNKYRVLLTRAREGMIIWVPRGDASDPYSQPAYYDGTAEFLKSCGVHEVDD